MDELLRQLGVAFKDGSLPELGQPITKAAPRARDTLVTKPTVAPSSAHIEKIALATQVGDPREGHRASNRWKNLNPTPTRSALAVDPNSVTQLLSFFPYLSLSLV